MRSVTNTVRSRHAKGVFRLKIREIAEPERFANDWRQTGVNPQTGGRGLLLIMGNGGLRAIFLARAGRLFCGLSVNRSEDGDFSRLLQLEGITRGRRISRQMTPGLAKAVEKDPLDPFQQPLRFSFHQVFIFIPDVLKIFDISPALLRGPVVNKRGHPLFIRNLQEFR